MRLGLAFWVSKGLIFVSVFLFTLGGTAQAGHPERSSRSASPSEMSSPKRSSNRPAHPDPCARESFPPGDQLEDREVERSSACPEEGFPL
jgi:hypothetical protein